MMLLPQMRSNFSFLSELGAIAWSAFCAAAQNFLRSRPNYIRQLNKKPCSLSNQIRQPCWILSPSEGVLASWRMNNMHKWTNCASNGVGGWYLVWMTAVKMVDILVFVLCRWLTYSQLRINFVLKHTIRWSWTALRSEAILKYLEWIIRKDA